MCLKQEQGCRSLYFGIHKRLEISPGALYLQLCLREEGHVGRVSNEGLIRKAVPLEKAGGGRDRWSPHGR